MARPTKLSPEVHQRIVAAIRAGNYAGPAARSAGVSEATFYRWMEGGRKQKRGIYRDFYDDVERAKADAEVEAVAYVRKAMPKDWRACMSYLERRNPDRWRRRDSHEHTGAGGGPVRIADAMFEDPEIRKELREILRRAGRARPDKPRGAGADG
jgi:hypothetical protein